MCSLFLFYQSVKSQEADIIFFNGPIITMEEDFMPVEALAVSGGKILSYGNRKKVMELQSSSTTMIDLKGSTIMPGIVDPHNHFFTDAAQILDSTLSIEERQSILLGQGITTIGDPNTESWSLTPIQEFEKKGNLKIKTNVYMIRNHGCNWDIDLNYDTYPSTPDKNARLRIAGIKIFTDGGSCGTLPATTFEYPGGGKGDLFLTDTQLEKWIKEADNKGYQIVIHAQGDRAIDQAQKKLGTVIEARNNPLRHRIDHNAFLNADILSKYNDIGIPVACFAWFPTCLATETTYLQETYGEDHLPQLEDWRSLIDANPDIHIAWHSDGPLLEYRLPQVMHSYVTRKEVKENGSVCEPPAWLADHKITIREVMRMMTIDAAYLLHRDNQVGSLKPGKSADLIILSDNPLTQDPDDLINLSLLMTMADGKPVFCHDDNKIFCNQILTNTPGNLTRGIHLGTITPNPSYNKQANIDIALGEAGNLLYEIYDLRGKLLYTSQKKFYDKGSYNLTIAIPSSKDNLYILKFYIKSHIIFRKLFAF